MSVTYKPSRLAFFKGHKQRLIFKVILCNGKVNVRILNPYGIARESSSSTVIIFKKVCNKSEHKDALFHIADYGKSFIIRLITARAS